MKDERCKNLGKVYTDEMYYDRIFSRYSGAPSTRLKKILFSSLRQDFLLHLHSLSKKKNRVESLPKRSRYIRSVDLTLLKELTTQLETVLDSASALKKKVFLFSLLFFFFSSFLLFFCFEHTHTIIVTQTQFSNIDLIPFLHLKVQGVMERESAFQQELGTLKQKKKNEEQSIRHRRDLENHISAATQELGNLRLEEDTSVEIGIFFSFLF